MDLHLHHQLSQSFAGLGLSWAPSFWYVFTDFGQLFAGFQQHFAGFRFYGGSGGFGRDGVVAIYGSGGYGTGSRWQWWQFGSLWQWITSTPAPYSNLAHYGTGSLWQWWLSVAMVAIWFTVAMTHNDTGSLWQSGSLRRWWFTMTLVTIWLWQWMLAVWSEKSGTAAFRHNFGLDQFGDRSVSSQFRAPKVAQNGPKVAQIGFAFACSNSA